MKVKTMRGQTLDMGRLIAQNEKAVALGNASMNARGDIVGAGGNVVRAREDVAKDYYNRNPKAVKQVSLRNISSEVFVSPAEGIAELQAPKKSAAPAPAPTAAAETATAKETAKEPAKSVTKRKIEDKE